MPKRIEITPEERNRLPKFGKPVGVAIEHLVSVVHPKTFARWKREVWVSPCTLHPTKDWAAQQARNFLMHVESVGLPGDQLLRDRDGKFAPIFDTILESAGIKVKKLPVRSPYLNAFIERYVQTLKHGCLNHFVIFGHKHLDYLVATFVDYYHTQRPHQSKDNEPLLRLTESPPSEVDRESEVLCEERLGGLIKHYYRKAA